MKLIAVLTLICLTVSSFTQTNEFAPIGAKWWYEYTFFSATGYKTLESIGDTTISGINCRIISSTVVIKDLSNPDSVLDTFYLPNEYIYSDSGVVYNYALGTFYILYDFNSAIGNSYEVGGISVDFCDSTGQVQVDSIASVNINGFDLKQIFISSSLDDYWFFGPQAITERIGSMNYLFPIPQDCWFDFYEGGPLRCYYDNDFGYYNADTTMSCEFVLNINQELLQSPIHVWPNPFSDKINISNSVLQTNTLLTIYNSKGVIVLKQPINEATTSINCIDFPKGIYLFDLSSSSFLHKTYKLIKL